MVIDLVSCSGCMACKNICPTDAISTIESKDGFILPHIDENKCVQCGLCEAVCDFKRSNHIGDNILNVYSLAHCDKSVIKHSSSGGAFTAFSDKVFEKGGVVYGVTYDEDFNIVYSAANTIEERNRMRGSKYVQSDPKLVYRQIKKDLEERLVLFVGTPCQCAGLRSYLKKGYNNLIIVDFLCHGVPNNRMFKEHISLISRRHKGNLVDYSFRAKQYGWNSYANVATFAELFQNHNSYAKKRQTKEDASWLNQAFLFFFSDNLSLRPSCFNCPYRNNHRPSDITIGDFWQIEYLTGHKDKNGVSFVSTNTIKGKAFISEIASDVHLTEYSLDQVGFRLPKGATPKPKNYDRFWETYRYGGYEKTLQAFFNNSLKARIRWEIKKIAKKYKLI